MSDAGVERKPFPLSYRGRHLVLSIVGLLADAERPLEEDEVGDLLHSREWSTVERVLRELVAFGAVHAVGGRRERAFEITPLGRAWIDREVGPWPWIDDELDLTL